MCGIAGIWHRDGAPVDRAALERMGELLRHRGPDASGIQLDGEIGLANRRLVIIDPTDGGAQPMALAERGLTLTYNGEVHNYVELRRELEAQGVSFRSSSDTEVVLRAYEAWGIDCFERFNGMWALAIWDARHRQLVLSRDRFGIKPLYYSIAGDRICFASEAKAILGAFPEERRPDEAEVFAFLNERTPDIGDGTFFRNVQTVPQSTSLVVTRGAVRKVPYWTFEPGDESPKPDAEERFRELLSDAVRLRLRSDVPLGVALSGGLDSSAVAALLDPPGDESLHAFSLKYEDPAFDESRYSELAGEGRFRIHWIRPDPTDMVETMRRIAWHHDGPTAPRGRFAQWFVMQETRRHVTVFLIGAGGDELLAGYRHFALPYLADRLRAGGRGGGREIRDLMELGGGRLLALAARPVRRRLALDGPVLRRVHSRELARRAGRLRPHELERPFRSRLNNALWDEFRRDGLPEVNHADDAMSMAFSLEARAPFLDHRLVEFCFSLPFTEKISGGWTKSLLRRALRGVVPAEILARRRKFGFPAPIGAFLKQEHNWSDVCDLLLEGRTRSRGVFDMKRLERELERFYGDPAAVGTAGAGRVWRWITLELWYRDFVDGEGFGK
jgi:asparagine synthase (glutamine-hydrolysing)